MEYTVNKLGKIAGISARTLRYYDEIGLLKPCRINSSGYRIYGQAEVDTLQQILFYRELGMGLNEIAKIIHDPSFDRLTALEEHLRALREREAQLKILINNVKKTILKEKGQITMTDKEKFDGLKKRLIEENEEKYGEEIREKYGEECVLQSNKKFLDLTQEQYEKMQALAEEINAGLENAVQNEEDPAGETGQKLAAMHKEWLTFTWPNYSKEAHAGVVQMYVDDERFTAFYDKNVTGCARFLRDAVLAYLNNEPATKK